MSVAFLRYTQTKDQKTVPSNDSETTDKYRHVYIKPKQFTKFAGGVVTQWVYDSPHKYRANRSIYTFVIEIVTCSEFGCIFGVFESVCYLGSICYTHVDVTVVFGPFFLPAVTEWV